MYEFEYQGKLYDLIYSDPPWSYNNKSTGGSMISGADAQYPTMTVEQIASIPIHKIAKRDSCLFMWAVTPLLPEAFYVMKKWGFNYKTTIYWRKKGKFGMGFWFRGDIELCLIGIKGDIKPFGLQCSNFIDIPPREHSRKPDEVYTLIESLEFKDKIEMFARERRYGWDTWGNQVPDTMQRLLEV